MDAKMLKLKKSTRISSIHGDDEDISSDDMIYSDDMQSDDELGSSCTGNESKRLKSLQNTDGLFRNRSKSKVNGAKGSAIKRMPTRKPDPKVSNRNAIMARENRRKKKEHMEVLQKTVEETLTENRKLKKMLSIRNNTITKLTQESLYLRSILANKTEIMSLLRCIQGNRTPITSSQLSFVADNDFQPNTMPSARRISNSSSGCSPASSMSPSSYAEDDKENDHEIGSHTDFTTTDSTSSYEQNIDDFQWENLLNEPTLNSNLNPLNISDLRDIDDDEILSTTSSNTVKNEHNYFNNPITNKVAENTDKSPGICLHVSSGRVSLEFCATCALNSQNAWCEEM